MDRVARLEDHLGYWMRSVSNGVSSSFARALAEHDTTVAEWVALRLLAEDEALVAAELAEAMGMTRGAIAKVLVKLEGKGWIAREERDRRSHSLRVIQAGRDALPLLARLADKNDSRYFDCLTSAERTSLSAILQKLCAVHDWTTRPVD